jgi:predicted nucleic acid-binding protein
MPKARVYVETTIPSFYHESRIAPSIVARREWTRQWWDAAVLRFDLFTSDAVLVELARGPSERRGDWLQLIEHLPSFPVEPAILEIVEVYVSHHLMPADPSGDALHLALASYHRCDFLVTWNCAHLANANKFGHIRRVNALLGLFVPSIVTPLELLGETNDDYSG